jgi:TolA-binding protein
LLLTDKKDRVLWFTEKYLQSLIKSKNGQEALKVFAASRAKFPDLALESAEITLAVAQLAWKAGDTRNAMALLKGFDKRFPKHALLPEAYELIARILEQGLGRTEQALAIYRAMKLQYANHPSTQEVAWFMRQHTGESTASVAPSAQPMGS